MSITMEAESQHLTVETYDVPILFLIFNRPNETRQSFQAIKDIKPKKLFIACDGPREENVRDVRRVAEVRKIVQKIDWDCKCEYLFHETNLGCGKGPAAAIDWFFGKVDHGIILEDDCLPTISFFLFCREMLAKYRDNPRIMAIAGTNITKGLFYKTDYVYSNFPIMWGWATWRRAWQKYDYSMEGWPEIKEKRSLVTRRSELWKLHPVYNEFFEKTYLSINDNTATVWDHQWIFCNWINSGLTVTSTKNLVRNIGFGADATHTISDDLGRGNFETVLSFPPYKGPSYITPHEKTDRYISKHWFTATWVYYLKIVLLRSRLVRSVWSWIKTIK